MSDFCPITCFNRFQPQDSKINPKDLLTTGAPDPPGKSSGTKATVPCPSGMATSAPPARDQTWSWQMERGL